MTPGTTDGRGIPSVLFEEPVRALVANAVRRLEDDLQAFAPFMAGPVSAWMRRLARNIEPAAYFTHPRGFPFILLPWWFERSVRGAVDVGLHERLIGSSISGYYFIRIVDGLMDGHAEDELEFLPALGVLHERFQSPYVSLFPAGHPFHDRFAETWAECLDATARDAALGAPTLDDFTTVSARKVAAASIPLQAVAALYGRQDELAPWMAFFDLLGRWHLMEEDLLDFNQDARREARTYVLCLAERRRGPGQSPVGWLLESGIDEVAAMMSGWMAELEELAAGLGAPEPAEYLAEREQRLRREIEATRPAFQALARLEAATGRDGPRRSVSSADLGVLAAESLACFLEDLDAAGIATDPALRLETTNGIVSYYDRSRAVISIATPGDSGPAAGLQRLAARSMLGLRDDRTLEELFRFAIPFTVAHELGHHLRHFHGRFGADLWHEEQVANMFASALQKRRYSPAERSDAAQLIAGVLEHFGSEGGSNDAVVDSYGSLLAALDAAGLISEATLAGIALIEKYVPDDSTTGELLPVELLLRLEHRESVVEEFGQMYTSDVLRYVYYQLGWLVIAMSSRESLHLDTLARTHLRAARLVLPPPAAVADEEHVRALGAAARHARTRSATGAAYFEFRYRDALLELLLESPDPDLRQAGAAARNLTSTTRSSDEVLDLVAPLLPTELRALLPAGLAASPLPEAAELSASIPAGTDRQMYEHVVLGANVAPAAATLAQLEMLWAIELFDRLSPAALLPLCETVATVHVRGGQTIVWEGDNDLDIYCLQQGQVEVIDGEGSRVRLMGEGELFGEVQYLLRGGRSKTIRAVTPSVLVAVPERELSFLVHRHPETGLQIARTLARRLA